MPGIAIPAPTGGWNAISPLTEMAINDAIVLENIIPYSTDVKSRLGYIEHMTSAKTNAHTLVSYNASTPKLLLGANGNIYDVTSSGAGTDLTSGLAAFTNNKWQTNGYKDKILFCNSADTPLEYDGTSVTEMALTTASGESATDALGGHGDFSSATGWTAGTGWSIAAGVASSDGTQTGDSDLSYTINPTDGRVYKVTFTVSNLSAGRVTLVVGDTEGTQRTANGTYSEYIIAGAGTDIDVRADADFVGDVDDVLIYATNLNVKNLAGSVTFKGRVFYWSSAGSAAPQSFFYAAAGAYTGTLTEYAMNEFTKGGYVASCFNWTHDGGQGLDDHFVVIMSTGQTLVYAGSDPGDATDWNLVGVYSIGEPVSGNYPITSVGGDAVILTKDGYVVLSAAIQDGRYSENSHYSLKISPAAAQAAQDYGANFGWEATLFAGGGLFIVNVPISSTNSIQHVRNTSTGAWCKWTGIAATSFASHDGNLYFAATDGKVYRYGGTSDNGGFIPMRATQAYTAVGDPHNKKQVTAIRVMSNYSFPKYLHSDFWFDYNEKSLPAISDPPEPTSSDWDVAQWDIAQWTTGVKGTRTSRRNASGMGFSVAHTLRLRSRAQTFIWYASHLYMKPAGVV